MKNRPKILLVIRSLSGRGGERSVLTLAQGFHTMGCEVHLLCFEKTIDYEIDKNFNYHLIDIRHWFYKLFITTSLKYKMIARDFDRYIKDNIGEPDLVLSNLIQANRILSNSQLENIVYVIRNTFSQENKIQLKKNPNKVLKRYQKIYKKHPCVCVSKGVENDLNSTLKDINKTITIYNPFDQAYIQQKATEFQPKYQDYILHVGAFCYAKAHDILLKSYANSSQKYPLLLLGKGELENEIRHLIKMLNLENKVHLLGFNKNPYPFIKNAKALILSSRYEGFVRVIPEALALGTSVISTDCPSGPNEILPSKNLVSVDNIEELTFKINQVMENPDDFKCEFSEKLLPENIAKSYLTYFNLL